MSIPDMIVGGAARNEVAHRLGVHVGVIAQIISGEIYPNFQDDFQEKLRDAIAIKRALPKKCGTCGVFYPQTPEFFHPLGYKRASIDSDPLARSCKTCSNKMQSKRRAARRLRVLSHYSGGVPFCGCCNVTDIEFLCIDHINGGGRKHRDALIGKVDFYKWIIDNNYPNDLRVLCLNCNSAYGIYGCCPHQQESS